MPEARLSPLDASFLAVETPTAHMHVGWAALFAPPEGRPRPTFAELRDHIGSRLSRAPRYRQRLEETPLGLTAPAWVDDEGFHISRHVIRDGSANLSEVVSRFLSAPLPHDRSLWQICIADALEDGRIGVVGKVHHCMVDGIAAVELASLLLDPDPAAPSPASDEWSPAPPPDGAALLWDGLRSGIARRLSLLGIPLRLARTGVDATAAARRVGGMAQAIHDAVRPAPRVETLNRPITPLRQLGLARRPLDDLREIKGAFGATINDVLLAAVAGAIRRYQLAREDRPRALKTMVPVSVREDGGAGDLGNAISFMFVDLPCDEPDPVRRLRDVQKETRARKAARGPEGASVLLTLAAQVPHRLQSLFSRLIASPRTFNLVVSNIPGPEGALYMCGCRLEEAYPVVPLADEHALSVGMTTVGDRAFFGLYADRRALPDVDRIGADLDAELDVLLGASDAGATRPLVAVGPG